MVVGTTGYEKAVERFASVSLGLSFEEVNSDFFKLLPPLPASVLDAGAGVGQNAAAFANLGYQAVAVEPLKEFVDIAKAHFHALDIEWINDALPNLPSLENPAYKFDFILVDGVWHHLCPKQRLAAINRFKALMNPGAICAISLRNGPAGLGSHVYPTCASTLCEEAQILGFEIALRIDNQDSILPNKEDVKWSRVALRLP